MGGLGTPLCSLSQKSTRLALTIFWERMIAWTVNAVIVAWTGQSHQVRATDWCHLLTIVPKYQDNVADCPFSLPMFGIVCNN